MSNCDLDAISWPGSRLFDGISALCRDAGISQTGKDFSTSKDPRMESDAGAWIEWTAGKHGCECDCVVTSMGELETELASASPAVLRISEDRYLLVRKASRAYLRLIAPSLAMHKIRVKNVYRTIAEPLIHNHRSSINLLLEHCQVAPGRSQAAFDFLVRDHLRTTRFDQFWRLRVRSGAALKHWFREANAFENAAAIFAAHTGQYLLWIASWAIIGQLSLDGHIDRGWLVAWGLMLATLIPLRLVTVWKQGLLAIGVGGMLKARLLAGAMRLAPDELRTQGVGEFLTQAFEAETVETLALSGGIDGLLALIEIALAGCLLGWISAVLLLCFVAALLLVYRFAQQYAAWTRTRFGMTQDLVEAMIGHRTRLTQQPRAEWHESEDQALDHYFQASDQLDCTGTWLMAAIPRIWLLCGIANLAPVILSSSQSTVRMAALMGAILLAYTALRRLSGSFTEIAAIWSAWKRIAPLFKAASRKENAGDAIATGIRQSPALTNLVDIDRLSFGYRPGHDPVLRDCTFSVKAGDRVLLAGPSGGGKTTFASLLTGMRQPQSGLLLVRGLDRQTSGDRQWRELIAAAPQFHENHILTGTLAFNLLMGRRWPPAAHDMEEAEALCRRLGLGDLLDRMPSGLMQMVGEGGWHLSHGERSRVYIARALLQRAELVILDESFGALDPENLQTALECTLDEAKTLIVIAHP